MDFLSSELDSIVSGYPNLIWILGSISVLTFFGTLLILPLILIRIPPDYFIHTRKERHPSTGKGLLILRLLLTGVKNITGFLLLILGFIMLFIPGQGLLTIMAGIFLMDFPGKRKMEISLISRNSIHNGINRIRRKAGKEDLISPPEEPL